MICLSLIKNKIFYKKKESINNIKIASKHFIQLKKEMKMKMKMKMKSRNLSSSSLQPPLSLSLSLSLETPRSGRDGRWARVNYM